MSQQENYKKRVWGQLENIHSRKTLKLRWNSRVCFAKNFRSVSAAVRGSISERDGLIPGQEYNRGREAAYQSSQELRSQAEATGATQG